MTLEQEAVNYFKSNTDAMKQMTLALIMDQAIQGVRPYDEIKYPLKDFIQDVPGSAE